MENSIQIKELKDILSNFPSSTKIIHIFGGTIFSFDSNILCFRKFPISGLKCSFEFKLINKLLDSFFDDGTTLLVEKDSLSLSFKNKTSTIEVTESEIPPKDIISIIQGIRKSEDSFTLKNKEEFKESVLFACSVARKDNLSGLLDCISITKSGEIISSDNVRALKIKVGQKLSKDIVIDAKKANQFFKGNDISKIILFKDWVGLYEKQSKMCFCIKSDYVEKLKKIL